MAGASRSWKSRIQTPKPNSPHSENLVLYWPGVDVHTILYAYPTLSSQHSTFCDNFLYAFFPTLASYFLLVYFYSHESMLNRCLCTLLLFLAASLQSPVVGYELQVSSPGTKRSAPAQDSGAADLSQIQFETCRRRSPPG